MHSFALSSKESDLPRTDVRIGKWHLAVAEHLPVATLQDAGGETIGAILGWPISSEEPRLHPFKPGTTVTAANLDELHNRHVRPLAGTYLAILSLAGETRIYLDGLANLTAVYDSEKRVAGGTAADLMSDAEYAERFDADLYRRFEIEREGWFPAGLTAHRGLERLMPNHYLDCERWETVRHECYDHVEEANEGAALSRIAEQIAICVGGALAAGERVVIGLTGGADSRLLLAGVRDRIADVEFYTVAPPRAGGNPFDLVRASELVERFDLTHEILPYRTANAAEQELWDKRVGACVITNNREQHPSVDPLHDAIGIGGLGGEVGRCFLWKDAGAIPQITATSLVDALKLPRDRELLSRVERWLETLPVSEPTRILDLAYIELRMGCWNSAQAYANPRSVIVHPLASFASIEAMLSLPPAYRQNDGMIYGFIRKYWPQLLELPINAYGDYRDALTVLRKLTNPTKLYRKLRQVLRTGA